MKNLKFTLKAWPVITTMTIGLCYLTQLVAGWVGIELPEQNQLEVVRSLIGWNWQFAKILVMVLLIAPVMEEALFRWLLFRLPTRYLARAGRWVRLVFAIGSSAVFSASHYPDWAAIMATGTMVWLPLSNAFVALFFFGLAQCWLYHRTGKIVYAMLDHLLFNLVNLVLLFLLPA